MVEATNAAILGQRGFPLAQNSLSHLQTHVLEKISCLYADHHTELQSLWQETGENKWQKLQELSYMISKAAGEIYRKMLEESRRQNLDIKERVSKSEARLKEHMGPRALQVIAPAELSLLVQLKRNLACLKDLYNAKIDDNVQPSLVLTRFCNQVFALKEMLNLSPCICTSLNEVLKGAIEALDIFYSGTSALSLSQLSSEHQNEHLPLFQLLHPFYRTLRAMEADLLFIKVTRKLLETLHCIETSTQPSFQDSRETVARKRSFDDKSVPTTPTCNRPEDSSTEFFGPKSLIAVKESGPVRLLSDDSSMLDKLGHKILKKLERITRLLKCEVEQDADMTETASFLFSQNPCIPSLQHGISMNVPPFSDGIKAGAPMHASVSGSLSLKKSSSPLCSSDSNPSTLQANSVVTFSQSSCESLGFQDQSSPIDAHQAHEYGRDLANSGNMPPECSSKQSHANMSVSMLPSLPAATKPDKELPGASCTGVKRLPLIQITNNQAASASAGKSSSQVLYPPPPPPPPPPLRQRLPPPPLPPPPPLRQRPPAMLPPPPPPPPPSSSMFGVKTLPSYSAKLKKSATISRLYMGMKKKAEGVASTTVTDASVQRRVVVGTGTREGMAEALAEITKRSEYFKKIEDDVNKQASSILYVKSQLETFQTHDMNELLRFHRSIEAHLEQLTDESQVLGRFHGFPTRKLETVRAAASLHLRLTSLMVQSENWGVEPPLSEHFDKVVAFFDKVKGDVEAIERTKDEDLKRFTCHKIQFSFEILCNIREAIVHLSSQCLALALKESRRTQKSAMCVDEAYTSIKELKKEKMRFQMLYRTFQLAYRAHNFAGGHDEMAEQLCCELSREMETYPSSFWLELVPKQ